MKTSCFIVIYMSLYILSNCCAYSNEPLNQLTTHSIISHKDSLEKKYSYPDLTASNFNSAPTSLLRHGTRRIIDAELPSQILEVAINGIYQVSCLDSISQHTNKRKIIYSLVAIALPLKANRNKRLAINDRYCSNDSSIAISPLLLNSTDTLLLLSLTNRYAGKIAQWTDSHDFKLAKQLGEFIYDPETKFYSYPVGAFFFNPLHHYSDCDEAAITNPFSTMGRQHFKLFEDIDTLEEGGFYLTDNLLQKGDSVFVGVSLDNSRRKFEAKIHFIDLRDPDRNHRSTETINDSVTMESWLDPKDTRLSTLSDKYGRIIAERIDWIKSHTLTPDPIDLENRWFDFLIVPTNGTDE